jgi:ornithine lipid ester-linked acyl 2-hydroxylase
MIPTIIILILSSLFLVIWYKEPRIFLLVFHRIIFPIRKDKALHINKSLNFPGSEILEKNWKLIYEELQSVLLVSKPLPKFHEVDRANHRISFDEGPAWRTLVLKAYDGWFPKNSKKFPKTFNLLKDMPEVSTVMFSILEPHAKIPSHTGKFSGILRYHLALIVPKGEDCFIEVNMEKYYWKEGEGILFNDTYLHSVKNNTDDYRVVLFLDITKRSNYLVQLINKWIFLLIRISPIFKKALKTGVINEI